MPDGKAEKSGSAFKMTCRVATTIRAPPAKVWALLTDAPNFPKWNPTVTSIEGPIRQGQRLVLKVPSAPSRTFKPRVSEFEPGKRMVWRDGGAPMFSGVRTFTLEPEGASTQFEMHEEFKGLMLPMIQGSLPDFAPIFEEYAASLKKAAEGS